MKKSIFILVIILIYSCNTDDLEVVDSNAISTETFPSTRAELEGAINATYSPLQSQGLFGRYLTYMFDYMADEVQIGSRGTADLRDFFEYTFTSANNDIYLYWKNCYNGISRANFILDRQDNINKIDKSVISAVDKDKFIGEAKYLRAYYYFLLVNRFGDVPLYNTTKTGSNGLGKSPKEDVYDLIFSDLKDAESKLLLKSVEMAGRVTKGSASALLGKIHLYRKEYAEAKMAFDKVIASGEYALEANFFDNFTVEAENNMESIFEVQFTYDNGNAWAYADWGGQDNGYSETSFRSIEYGGLGGFHNNDPSQSLLDEYEANDPRFEDSFFVLGDLYGPGGADTVTAKKLNGIPAFWRKYQKTYGQSNSDGGGLSDINHRVIRYADVLLMAAEAENELGNMAAAIDLMNQVRDRVGMPNYGTAAMDPTFPVGSKAEVFAALVHERRVELAGEQARFRDILRWGMTGLLPSFKTGKHELLPIPQTEIDTNLNLSNANQNPGY